MGCVEVVVGYEIVRTLLSAERKATLAASPSAALLFRKLLHQQSLLCIEWISCQLF